VRSAEVIILPAAAKRDAVFGAGVGQNSLAAIRIIGRTKPPVSHAIDAAGDTVTVAGPCQHTVSPCVMFSALGVKTRPPCPTVTSHTRGPGLSHGVARGRGVGVGLVLARDESERTARNRTQTNLLFWFLIMNLG
jgi:hypothetical protein